MGPRPPPPPELSLLAEVKYLWNPILKDAKAGSDVEFHISQVSQTIEQFETALNSGKLPPDYDWTTDIEKAHKYHDFYVSWVRSARADLEKWYAFWNDRLQTTQKFSLQLAQEGLKYILLLHGATAIACLNAITTNPKTEYKLALLTGMFGAVVGIGLLVIGQIILLNVTWSQNNRISGKLLLRKQWIRLRAISRWIHAKHARILILADIFIYGSIVWFGLYVLVCLSIIANT